MFSLVLKSYSSSKKVLGEACHLTNLSCDNNAQCVLRQAELDARIGLNGSDMDPTGSALESTILNLVAARHADERIHDEMASQKESHACRRKQEESLSTYVNRYK